MSYYGASQCLNESSIQLSEQRDIAREVPGVREHETEQRAAAREVPGVREHETEQRDIARAEPGVREHETEERWTQQCKHMSQDNGQWHGKKNLRDGVQVGKWEVSISSALWLME